MSAKCHECGRPVQFGQLVCECGAEIGIRGPELPGIGGLDLPALKVPQIPSTRLEGLDWKKPETPSLDFSLPDQKVGRLPGMEKITLDGLNLDFVSGRVAQGHAYRPLLSVGRDDEGNEILRMPFGVVQLADDSLYVVDFVDEEGQARVQLFDAAGAWVRTIRRFEIGDEQEALDTPAGIAADVENNFYIADMGTSCVKKFSPDGSLLAILGSEGVKDNQLMSPQDVDLDAEGNIYIADTDNNRILKWDPQGNCLLVLGINELEEDADWMMAGEEPGEFDGPQGVAVDGAGHILVTDSHNHRIQKFGPRGEFLLLFGQEGEGAGELYYPNDVRVDSNGDIYVSDSNGSRIQKFASDGCFIYQIILPSDAGAVGDFEVDDQGHILVALRHAHLVLKLAMA